MNELLVVNISGIGDFIDSVPALRRLRRNAPRARITLLVAEKALPLAASCPYIDEAIGLPTKAGTGHPALRSLPKWFLKLAPLRGRFSAVINLYDISSRAGALWTRLWTAWFGAAITVGIESKGRGAFFTRRVPDNPKRDQLDAYLEAVSFASTAIGPPLFQANPEDDTQDKRLELWIQPEIIAQQRNWLNGLSGWKTLDGPLTLVALGGDRISRHELPERAEKWLSELQKKFKIRPVLCGTKRDPGLPKGSSVTYEDARGRTDFVHSAAMFPSADAIITTHSAPQHLAGVWDVPTMVLVGPGDASRYRPHVSADAVRMLRHPVDCSPCYYQDCPWSGADYKKCLRGISTETIVASFGELLPAIHRRMRERNGL